MKLKIKLLFVLIMTVMITQVGAGQEGSVCDSIDILGVQDRVSESCGDITDQENVACYANFNVEASPIEEISTIGFFDSLSDSEPLTNFSFIQTSADFARDTSAWGIVAMSLSTDDPDEPILLIFTGDTRWELVQGEGPQNVRNFLFETTESPCSNAPSTVSIQTPDGAGPFQFQINGAPVIIGSTVVLRIRPPGNTIEILVLDGEAIVEQTTGETIIVPEGTSALSCLSNPQNVGTDGETNDRLVTGCDWTVPEAVAPDEIATLQVAIFDTFDALRGQRTPSTSCPAGTQNYTHTVAAGENLFRIARRYDTTISQIAADNNLASTTTIVVGQTLQILCGRDSGQSSRGPTNPGPGTGGYSVLVGTCTALDTFTQRISFSWSGAAASGVTARAVGSGGNTLSSVSYGGASGQGVIDVSRANLPSSIVFDSAGLQSRSVAVSQLGCS